MAQWRKITPEEFQAANTFPCPTPEQVKAFQEALQAAADEMNGPVEPSDFTRWVAAEGCFCHNDKNCHPCTHYMCLWCKRAYVLR